MMRALATFLGAALLAAAPAYATAPNVALGKTVNGLILDTPSSGFNGASFSTLTDGVFFPEAIDPALGIIGQGWTDGTVFWSASAAQAANTTVQVDLGGLFEISGFKIQADNNDFYKIKYASGGSWLDLAQLLPPVFGFGMVARDLILPPGSEIVTDRLLVLGFGGDSAYALSEIQVFGVPIPEPGTYLTMLAGLGLLAAVARRRLARR
jgi:hypothetical protein